MKTLLISLFMCSSLWAVALNKSPIGFSGTVGASYENYGLVTNPSTPSFYSQRRPWSVLRFTFNPTISIGKIKIPFNFNFSPNRFNFGAAPFGFGSLPGFPRQTLGQWLSNPMNNFGINPSYKWAELQLGTQYLKYSDLSTGDIGAFGYGFSLKPSKYRLKFFHGVSQQAFQPFTPLSGTPIFVGTYKRNITMAQIGLEEEGKYFAGFNLVKSSDVSSSITSPYTSPPFTTPLPANNFIVSFNTKVTTEKGWYGKTEFATTFSTRDVNALGSSITTEFRPFINSNSSSYRDHAIQANVGKKGKDWDVGLGMKWLGAGYNTMGYPFTQNDRLEYTVNTKFNAFKKKTNVVASVGQRWGNWSIVGSRTRQIIANVNVFTQFNDKLSLNANYNNFGFNALGGLRNVGNDLGINPMYTWTTKKMSNLLSLNYNWSTYKEISFIPPLLTTNNTHNVLLLYAPTFFNKPNLSPDISAMYFTNNSSIPTDLRILSLSTSLGYNIPKKSTMLRGQLSFNNTLIRPTTLLPSTASNNIQGTISADIKLTKRLKWTNSATGNLYKYGNELAPPITLIGARYFESTIRTSLQYRFGK
jgi:hypothetical protein